MGENRYDLASKRAIVTGGAGGIGRAIARRMIASGAQVELWDVSEAALQAACRDLPDAVPHRVNITREEEIEAVLAPSRRIDILVNNAGILGEVRPIVETDPAIFRRVLEVNLVGAYLMARAVARRMLAQTPAPLRGHIVNVASVQGKEGMAQAGAYAASKAGMIALTKTLAKETAREGIVVTCLTPAAAETAMAKEIDAARRADIVGRIPMGRFVEVEEIAAMICFLASDDNSFATGGIFDLSGGRSSY